jgi:hypothetical protein
VSGRFNKIATMCKNSLSENIIDIIYPEYDEYFLINAYMRGNEITVPPISLPQMIKKTINSP